MTSDEILERVLTLTGESDDEILTAYIEQAGDIVLRHAYPFDESQTEVPAKYHKVQIDIAVYLLNKRGAEGQTIHTENGISRRYEDGDVPPTLLRRIMPMAGVAVSSSTTTEESDDES